MNTPDILISIAILILLAIAVWTARRSGAANPVPTGKLQRDVSELRTRMSKIEVSVAGIRSDLDGAPTKADIARMEGRVETVVALGEKTDQAVVRIEQLLMGNALNGRSGQ